MTKVSPQRIINEAIRLIEEGMPFYSTSDQESAINNVQELDSLQKALHRDGIINIREFTQ